MLVNGLRVLFGLGINGLTNIDQDFDPNSENPQSGIAIGTHLQNNFADVKPTDQHFDPESENAQSGIAIDTHLQNTFAGVRPTDQHFDPESENAQSGIAVAEAVAAQYECPLKMYWDMYDVSENTSVGINLVTDENRYYTVYGVLVTMANGEVILCDVGIDDYTRSGGCGVCYITLSFSETIDERIAVLVLYTDMEVGV